MIAKLLGPLTLVLSLLPTVTFAIPFDDALKRFSDSDLSFSERLAAGKSLRDLPGNLKKSELDALVGSAVTILLEVESENLATQELGVVAADLLAAVVTKYRSSKAASVWNELNDKILPRLDSGFLFTAVIDAAGRMGVVAGNDKNKEKIVSFIKKRLATELAKPPAKRSRLSTLALQFNLDYLQGTLNREKWLGSLTPDLLVPGVSIDEAKNSNPVRLIQELHRYVSQTLARLVGDASELAVEPRLWVGWMQRLGDRKTYKRSGDYEPHTRANVMNALANVNFVATADSAQENLESSAIFEVMLSEDNDALQHLWLDVCQRWALADPSNRYKVLMDRSLSILDDDNHLNVKVRYYAVINLARFAPLVPEDADMHHDAWAELMQEIEDPATPVEFCRDAVWAVGLLSQLTLNAEEKAHTAEVLKTACLNHRASTEVCDHAQKTAEILGIAI